MRPLLPQHIPLEEPWTSSYRTSHSTLQLLPSVLPPSVDLEGLISHPDPQAWQGLITRHLLHAHPAVMLSGQAHQGAHLTLYQRMSLTSSISTRLQTVDYICPPPAHHGHRVRLQPAGTTSPHTVCVTIDLTAAFNSVS